jgi:hypothetical protein
MFLITLEHATLLPDGPNNWVASLHIGPFPTLGQAEQYAKTKLQPHLNWMADVIATPE